MAQNSIRNWRKVKISDRLPQNIRNIIRIQVIESAFNNQNFTSYLSSLSDEVKAILGILTLQDICESYSMITLYNARRTNVKGKTVFAIASRKSVESMLEMVDSIHGEVLLDGTVMMKTKITKGLYYVFMCYYAFSLKYAEDFVDVLMCIKRLFMKWSYSKFSKKVKDIVQNLLTN